METPTDLTPSAEVLAKGGVLLVPEIRVRTLRQELHEAGYALVLRVEPDCYGARKYGPVRPAPQAGIYNDAEERALWMATWAAVYATAATSSHTNHRSMAGSWMPLESVTPSMAASRADLAVTELRALRAQGG